MSDRLLAAWMLLVWVAFAAFIVLGAIAAWPYTFVILLGVWCVIFFFGTPFINHLRDVVGTLWYGDILWNHKTYGRKAQAEAEKKRAWEEKKRAWEEQVAAAQLAHAANVKAVRRPPTPGGRTGASWSTRQVASFPANPFNQETAVLPDLEDLGLAIEPIIAMRAWEIAHHPTLGLFLMSAHGQHCWQPREPFEAICDPHQMANPHHYYFGISSHDAPAHGCTCGIYAWTPGQWGSQATGIWGEVYLWGNVLIAERGYRAEYAYPKSLNIVGLAPKASQRAAEAIEERYGIPVEVRAMP